YPFDDTTFSPKDDRQKCEAFKQKNPEGAKTMCWIPSFFSEEAKKELGTLLILEHILTGERFASYANHLSPQDRPTAKSLLESQQSALSQRVRRHIDAAYGISSAIESLDNNLSLELNEQFVSLKTGFELYPPTAANLKGGLTHLLDQALQHEFPAAPDFQADANKLSSLQKIYEFTSQAAQTADGRIEVESKYRPSFRNIADPLKLGEMGETHFVLGQNWKTHFNKEIAKKGSNPQVSDLRKWIDMPKPMGLSLALSNLIILTYAEQTSRSFFRHNNLIDVALKDIPSDCELREQKLPDEADWENARQRAKDIFGISIVALRKASTVSDLEKKVQQKADSALESCQSYVQALQDSLETLQLEKDCDRLSTAATTLAMVEQLSAAKPEDIVGVLAKSAIATSAAAMSECLKKAATLTGNLQGISWDIVEGIRALTGERQSKADTILNTLTQALTSDEHVIELRLQLQQCQSQAVRLLTQQQPVVPPVSPPPVSPPVTPPPVSPPVTPPPVSPPT
ncbi:MAG: hypothetical protein WBD47_19205, partial [Phormidesmis sp.]